MTIKIDEMTMTEHENSSKAWKKREKSGAPIIFIIFSNYFSANQHQALHHDEVSDLSIEGLNIYLFFTSGFCLWERVQTLSFTTQHSCGFLNGPLVPLNLISERNSKFMQNLRASVQRESLTAFSGLLFDCNQKTLYDKRGPASADLTLSPWTWTKLGPISHIAAFLGLGDENNEEAEEKRWKDDA